MKPLVLAVPTLTRYDLLKRLVESSERGLSNRYARPDRYLIIDNGGTFDAEKLGLGDRVHVIRPGRNLGVAASWNLALKTEHPDADLVIANDDVVAPRVVLERMRKAAERKGGAVHVRAGGFGLFLQTPEVAEQIGYYDEEFWPAYWEDIDYERRLSLGRIPVVRLTGIRQPDGSQTLRTASRELKQLLHKHEHQNSMRYYAKWGGPRGQEKFRVPFGKAS